ncbi:hypothetical protein, partial [Pseudomonas anguilliseptica]|uniref:hypothetical protein n=1 Tax=Pseudomonas anguilliseptica TaxID=53406 RepID=UPI003735024B
MKGLRELALSCLLFACAANAMATEIASNLQKLDPLVYFGAEGFELDEVRGLNRGRAESNLSFSSNPVTVPSFLSSNSDKPSHAGQALQLNGQDALTLQASFLTPENLDRGVVLGLFGQRAYEPDMPRQCLLSIGDEIAVVLDEGSYSIFQQGQSVVFPEVSGLSEPEYGLFLVFSESKIQLFSGFSLVHEMSVPASANLAAEQIVLGNCSDSVKQNLLEENIGGFEGRLDELVALANRTNWAQSYMELPNLPEAMSSDDESSINSVMTRVVLLQASLGAYPTRMRASSTAGEYVPLDGQDFVGFIYPAGEFLPVETSAELMVAGAEEAGHMDSNSPSSEFEMLVKGDGFLWPNPIENVLLMRVNCYGGNGVCQAFYSRLNTGVAFAAPRALKTFALEHDSLQYSYDRTLADLSFSFNDVLTLDDELVLGAEHVRLYKKADGSGDAWNELSVSKVSAQGSTVKLAFTPRLKSGHYRVVFAEQLSSHAGVALGGEQSHEFTVTQSEVLINSDTSISAIDYQHDGKRLIVDGATLTLAGTHNYETVVVRNSGVITAPTNQRISISADEIDVDASSRIDVSAKGNPGTTAINFHTGGSYGGRGGVHSNGSTNTPYGDFREPRDFGTGGRQTSTNFTRGGGALELQVDELKLDGLIQANGQVISSGSYGSGSGGSLLLRVGQLVLGEQARIEASGGGAATGYAYGGGGGGRVAVYYDQVLAGSVVAQVLARGGLSTHSQPGAAGSVYLHQTGSAEEELRLDNTGVPLSAPPALLVLGEGLDYDGRISLHNVVAEFQGDQPQDAVDVDAELIVDSATLILAGEHTYQSINLRNSSVLTSQLQATVDLRASTIEVDASSRIDVSAKGNPGTTAINFHTGGSYGGRGGVYSAGYATNAPYGDFREPRDFGTGGRQTNANFTRGGGALELQVDELKLDGLIQANGQVISSGSYGSGSGGSLLLRV